MTYCLYPLIYSRVGAAGDAFNTEKEYDVFLAELIFSQSDIRDDVLKNLDKAANEGWGMKNTNVLGSKLHTLLKLIRVSIDILSEIDHHTLSVRAHQYERSLARCLWNLMCQVVGTFTYMRHYPLYVRRTRSVRNSGCPCFWISKKFDIEIEFHFVCGRILIPI